jgi:hypothetical protein
MYAEMKVWINDMKCRFDMEGDDQSIHNWIFYAGDLPFAMPIKWRENSIVNTIGKIAAVIWKEHMAKMKEKHGLEHGDADRKPLEGSSEQRWLPARYGLTDSEGYFTEYDGTRSRVVHQWDRFGGTLGRWMRQRDEFADPMPRQK